MAKKAKKRTDGRREGKYTFGTKRYSIYGETKAERDAKWELKKAELIERAEKEGNEEYKKAKDMTIVEYMRQYVGNKFKIGKIKAASIRSYNKLITSMSKQLVRDGIAFGSIPLVDIEKQDIIDLIIGLREELSTRTTNDCISLLKKALRTAYEDDVIRKNPSKTIERLPKDPEEDEARDTIHRMLTADEVDRFLEEAKESWYYNLFVVMLYTGMRVGEASAFSLGDIHGDEVFVHRTVVRTDKGYEVMNWTKTDAGTRTLPLQPQAQEAINRQRQIEELLRTDRIVDLEKPIFRMPKGGVIRPDRVNTEILRICKKAGVEKFTNHAFRATYISILVNSGLPLTDVLALSGHNDIKMTEHYAHNEKDQTKARLFSVDFRRRDKSLSSDLSSEMKKALV